MLDFRKKTLDVSRETILIYQKRMQRYSKKNNKQDSTNYVSRETMFTQKIKYKIREKPRDETKN